MKTFLAIAILFITAIPACSSDSADPVAGPNVSFAIETEYTIYQTNKILIKTVGDITGYTMMINGNGFTADIPFNVESPIVDTITVTYTTERNYQMGIAILRDGVPYIEEFLTWSYSEEPPYDPILSFSEKATNDDDVQLFITAHLTAETKQIWVQGDFVGGEEGKWFKIPDTFAIPLKITAGDGTKYFTAKTRNSYGLESEIKELTLLRKSTGPTNCSASLASKTIVADVAKGRVAATDPYELNYQITGDVRYGHKGVFTDHLDLNIYLIQEVDTPRHITMKIWDIAGNECEPEDITIIKQKDYSGNEISLVGEPVWTDEASQQLLINFEAYANQVVEMRITGGVVDDANTKDWVAFDPFNTTIPIQLQSPGGQKDIYVDFRVDGIITDATYSTTVGYLPSIEFNAQTSKAFVPNFTGATYSITGCTQTYQNVVWVNGFSCTAFSGTTLSATFVFSDKSTATRTLLIP